MKKTLCRGLITCLSIVALSACQDYDAGFNVETIKKAEYDKHFVKTFGEVDPEQDWSMAASITANVQVAGASSNCVVSLYTDKPVYATSNGLTMFQGNTAQFNAVKGTEQVFAIVQEAGKVLAQGYYDVNNGVVNISDQPVAKKMVLTRADNSNSCTAQKGDVIENFFTGATGTVDKYKWKSETTASDVVYYTKEQLIAWGQARQSSMTQYAHSPFGNDCVKTAAAQYDFTSAAVNNTKVKIADKTGYFCTPGNVNNTVYSEGIYTLDELEKILIDNVTPGSYQAIFNNCTKTVSDGIDQYGNPLSHVEYDWSNATLALYNVNVTKNDYIYHIGHQNDVVFSTLAAMQTYTENNSLKNDGPFTNCWFDAYTYIEITSSTTIDTNTAPIVKEPITINLTPLTGVETSSANPWTLEIGYNLFGPNAFFCEQNYYWGPKTTTFDKTTLYGSTDAEKLETMKKIESGFSITTKTGTVVDVPFIYGATLIPDIFGYVYYKEGQDPLTQPHYMLMSNGTPTANIFYNTWKTGKAVGAMELAGWASATPQTPLSGLDKSTNVYGTKYTLAFFGENHDKPATHEFESGYKIVFFISNTTNGQPTKPNCGNFNYSLPELNERLGHLYGTDNKNSLTYKNGVAPAGAVKAAAWTYKGNVFMGFEDGGQDEDLNDIVFWVEGDFETNDIIKVKTREEQMTNSWIFAAEDLGGTWDYDFNDVVWEVSQTNSHKTVTENGTTASDELQYGKIKINVLASGGTLPVELVYNDEVLAPGGKSEIHQLFGQEAGNLYTPVNVGSSADKQKITLAEIETDKALNISDFSSKFKLKVSGSDGDALYVTSPQKGQDKKAPQIIVLPSDWEWPTENTPITTAYQNFENWVKDATWAQWSTYKSGPVTKRGVITSTANGSSVTETEQEIVVPSDGSQGANEQGGGQQSGGENTSTKLTLKAKTGEIVSVGNLWGNQWNGYKIVITEGNSSNVPDGTYTMSFTGTAAGACIRDLENVLVPTNNGGPITFTQDVLKQLIAGTAFLVNAYGNTDFSSTTMTITQN